MNTKLLIFALTVGLATYASADDGRAPEIDTSGTVSVSVDSADVDLAVRKHERRIANRVGNDVAIANVAVATADVDVDVATADVDVATANVVSAGSISAQTDLGNNNQGVSGGNFADARGVARHDAYMGIGFGHGMPGAGMMRPISNDPILPIWFDNGGGDGDGGACRGKDCVVDPCRNMYCNPSPDN